MLSADGDSEGEERALFCILGKSGVISINCAICGKAISGKYVRDYWGNIYHAEHSRELVSCFYCSRLISKQLTGGGKKYSDGRAICALCLKSAVTDAEEAKALVGQARGNLQKHGITVQGKLARVMLLERSRLRKVSGRRRKQSEEAGYTRLEKKVLNGRLISFSMQIYILRGLPRLHFIATAAHELMHVWQHLYAVPENDRGLREGSCNYAAYLVLQEYARNPEYTGQANYINRTYLENSDPVYGKGFQKIYRLAQNRGSAGWLEYLKKNKR